MAIDPHRISLPDALALVQRAQKSPPRLVKGWSIDGAIIKEILGQDGATGLRAYMAAKADGEATLVYLGIDGAGRDMTEGTIAEYVRPCPRFCHDESPFTSTR